MQVQVTISLLQDNISESLPHNAIMRLASHEANRQSFHILCICINILYSTNTAMSPSTTYTFMNTYKQMANMHILTYTPVYTLHTYICYMQYYIHLTCYTMFTGLSCERRTCNRTTFLPSGLFGCKNSQTKQTGLFLQAHTTTEEIINCGNNTPMWYNHVAV